MSRIGAHRPGPRQQLETGNARYEEWSAATYGTRDTAGRARAELERRGHAQPTSDLVAQPTGEPQTMASWWHEFQAHAEAIERALARQHQAAVIAGEPWPPQHAPGPTPPSVPSPDLQVSLDDDLVPAQPAPDDTAARLDELLARVDQAAQRVAARETGRQVSSDYSARVEREAQAEPEQQAETQAGPEIEL